jgi:hypothetical protein
MLPVTTVVVILGCGKGWPEVELEEEVIEDTRKGLADPDRIFGVLVRVWRVDEDGSDVLESRPVNRHVFLGEYQGWFSRGQRMGPSD